MARARGRAVFLALDSVGHELLAECIADGSMPTVRGLLERGQFFPIEDTQELITAPSWPTILRGCEPAEHLQIADRRLAPGTYTLEPVAADDAERPPFWAHIDAAGLRSTILSVYGAPVVPGLNGTQVVGWGSHDPFNGKVGGEQCEPPEAIPELERLVGPRPSMYWDPGVGDTQQSLDFLHRMLDGIPQQGRALSSLLERRDYDFLFASISECHQSGHLLWRYWDESHRDHDPEAPQELKDGLRSIYRATDRAYGEALKHADPEAGVFLVSPYTMKTNHHLFHVLDAFLQRGGWLRRQPGTAPSARLRLLGAVRKAARHAAPLGVRRRLHKLVPFERRARWLDAMRLADVDWSSTRVFPLPSDTSASFRINLAGREPAGTVQPGSEYEALRDEIAAALTELEDADSGQPVVARVATAEEAFGCPARGPMPDLVVQWHRLPHRVRAVRSPALGEIEIVSKDQRSSIHRSPGFVIAAGPGIPPSGHTRLEGPPIKLVDVAPTALAWLGVPEPDYFSGAAIPPLARSATRA